MHSEILNIILDLQVAWIAKTPSVYPSSMYPLLYETLGFLMYTQYFIFILFLIQCSHGLH
jgi:hypothetical protein